MPGPQEQTPPAALPHTLFSVPGLLTPCAPATSSFCFSSCWYWDLVSVISGGGRSVRRGTSHKLISVFLGSSRLALLPSLLSCPAHSPPAAGLSALLTHSPPVEVQGNPLSQEDEASSPSLLSQMQESLLSYWDTAKTTAQDLYQKTYLSAMDEKIRYHPTPTQHTRCPGPQPLLPQTLCPFSPGTCTAKAQRL